MASTVLANQPVPAGGTDVLAPDLEAAVRPTDPNGQFSRHRWVDVSGQPFARALEIATDRQPPSPWGVQVKWVNDRPLATGDVVLAEFHLRATRATAETGEASVDFTGQLSREPWDGVVSRSLTVGKQWQQVLVPFEVRRDWPAGDVQFAFNLGYRPQTVEVGGVRVVNYGASRSVRDLPMTRYTYAGREPDAAWRKPAAERIERHRKADLVVTVVGPDGRPVPGAAVQVRMVRHAFGFGTCVVTDHINGTGPDDDRYRDVLARYFNKAVFENDLKWPNLEWRGRGRWGEIDQAIAWLRDRGFGVRGHNLVWPGERWLPDDVKAMTDPDQVRARVNNHIRDAAGYFAGKLDEWDVVNEPVHNHALQDILGRDAMVEWFKLARQYDPHAKLYLNDYTMLSGGARDTTVIDAFYDNVRFLIDRGAPIDGIGEQGHFAWNATPPARMLEILDRFAGFGLPIQITEYDMNVTDEDLQADYLRDFYTAAFSHPSVNGVLMWGFWEASHWMPDAAPWRRDWSMRRAAEVYVDLTTRQWWTTADLTADGAGSARTRGFLGAYDITATVGGKTKTVRHELTRDAAAVEVRLGSPATE